MDKIIHQLGELLLTTLPTFILLLFLNYYLKFVFFKPLEKALKQRYEATGGARKLAEESMQRAAAKTAAYEETLRAAHLDRDGEDFVERIQKRHLQSHRQTTAERVDPVLSTRMLALKWSDGSRSSALVRRVLQERLKSRSPNSRVRERHVTVAIRASWKHHRKVVRCGR